MSTAKGMADLVSKWLVDHGLDLCKVRAQGYDGDSVMSGKVGGVHKCFLDIIKTYQTDGADIRASFVHCAFHNLNLVINDAAETTVVGITFFDTISEMFNFFGRSLNRWAVLALTEDGMKKLKLKELYTTCWSSRIQAVRALKNRYADILNVLMQFFDKQGFQRTSRCHCTEEKH